MNISTAISNSGRRFTQVETWTYGLLNASLTGGASAVSSWLGLAAAHSVGVDVPVLNFKGIGIMFLSGAGVKFFQYLSQGLPSLTRTVDTSVVQQSPDGTVTAQTSRTTTVTPALTSDANAGSVDPLKQPKI